VQLGDTVGALGQPEAHDRHVEDEGVAVRVAFPAQVQDLGHRHIRSQAGVEEVLDLRGFKAVDAGGHGRVGREHRGGPSGRQRFFPGQRLLRGHHFLDPLDAEEAGVAFVGVEHLGGRAARELLERPQGLDPAHAQQQFLLQAVVTAAAVQAVRDAAGGVVIAGHVGVQQQERNTPDVGPPDVRQQPAPVGEGQGDLDGLAVAVRRGLAQQRQGQAVGVQDRVGFLLPRVAGE
jgi:hypothetical protein